MFRVDECIVSYGDMEGIRHVVRMWNAKSVFEAAARGLRAFRNSKRWPGVNDPLTVTITYQITPAHLQHSLNSEPKDSENKNRIRGILNETEK